ncbi:MAG: recombinase family protein [Oscillospiraceae bacterium]|nr:recombinase family protein [Oscillospiraceae bacterium]
MRSDKHKLAYTYIRLSSEDTNEGESASISNQRNIIQSYCEREGITILHEYVDDGWSGSNFERPGFQQMIRDLERGNANMVITKDLSRLGRDMAESSYYAETYFPERGIEYVTVTDPFDPNGTLNPVIFAINEIYLRDGSKKVKTVLKDKRERGEYCACPPYGYCKHPDDHTRLIPDEQTAPVVQRIFRQAAAGDSSRTIAMELTRDGILPPLKYRILYRDNFSAEGAARSADAWNYTTVKRILKNEVYLGHTILGKTRKASIKSKVKRKVPREEWAVTKNTHEALIDEATFLAAQRNMGRGRRLHEAITPVRKSIFGGVAYCALCGHALCSCGTVYKGEREKYWYLSCTHQRGDLQDPCSGVRIRYADLCEVVRQELNELIAMTDEEIDRLVESVVAEENAEHTMKARKLRLDKIAARLSQIDSIIRKLYQDNAAGSLSDDRLRTMVMDLELESRRLKQERSELDIPDPGLERERAYRRFFALAQAYSYIEELDWETVHTFIDRIEVGPKILPEGVKAVTHDSQSYTQEIHIYYRFIGDMTDAPGALRLLPPLETDAIESPV